MKAVALLARAATAFDRWVCEPVDPRPLAWFRAWFGVLTLANLWLLWPDMPMWLGNDGVLPPAVHREMVAGMRLTVYQVTGYSDAAIWIIRGLGLAGGIGLALGIFPRAAACCAWLAAGSYGWRNLDILHSGDNLFRIGAFFLMFAPGGGPSVSRAVGRWLQARRGGPQAAAIGDVPAVERVPGWPQRILQLQLCVLYLVTGIWKASGASWRDGTAVGTVLQLGEFQRFPLPDFMLTPFMSQLLTYGTLAFELGFPVLIWIPALRVPLLLGGLAFHAGLDYAVNVQLFQWVITAYYLLFVPCGPRPQPAAGQPFAAGFLRSQV